MKERGNEERMPYGYPVNSGYEGLVEDRFMLFPTEQEYLDFVDWYYHRDEED